MTFFKTLISSIVMLLLLIGFSFSDSHDNEQNIIDKAKELSNSLNGYLNLYKNFMTSSLKALDFFKENIGGKNCNTEGCKI